MNKLEAAAKFKNELDEFLQKLNWMNCIFDDFQNKYGSMRDAQLGLVQTTLEAGEKFLGIAQDNWYHIAPYFRETINA